jgi:hypothetical protein
MNHKQYPTANKNNIKNGLIVMSNSVPKNQTKVSNADPKEFFRITKFVYLISLITDSFNTIDERSAT